MIERRVACFPPDNASLPRLRAALGTVTELAPFADVGALNDCIRTGTISATVMFVDVTTIDVAETALRRLRANFPVHPLIAYYNGRGLTPRSLIAIAQSGITELVQLDVDDSRLTFARILNSASRVTYAQTLADLLKNDVPEEIHSILLFSLEHAGRRLEVTELAATLGLSKRTLSWRMAQQGAPSPRLFLTWCRLLVASLLLNESGRTLDSVADQLNFSSGHSLGGVFFRHMGRGIIVLRRLGVLDQALAAFREEISGPTGDSSSLPTGLRQG